ncbi:MAG: PilX N-terminal domain-containing pilus assembly protein [Pseudomonadota bacterium]|nr:PilX N-terminal domain-containing pilus assembly protein [Pseudomonadota bacterium]
MFRPDKKSQQGVVLIVSLLILLVMTMIGISALSNTSMEERMSNNFQQSMIAFQASESAIAQTIMKGDEVSPSYSKVRDTNGISADPLLSALDAGLNTTTTTLTYNGDPGSHLRGATLSTVTTVSYQGENVCASGTSIGTTTCLRYELRSDTKIAASTTGPRHIQGILRESLTP